MPIIIEPYYEKKTIAEYLIEYPSISKIGIVFCHGVGDCVMFMNPFDKLRALFPQVHFDIILQRGLGQEVLFPGCITVLDINKDIESMNHNYIFKVHFPVEIDGMTKSELCCDTELGIKHITGHKPISKISSPLVAVHFQNTALPSVFNTPYDVAKQIWQEIKDAGCIPIEMDFTHVFHNPINEKYDFIDCHVRSISPTLEKLIGLLSSCKAAICAVSGNLHLSLSIMPDRVFFLEKEIPITRFTYYPVPSVNVKNYQEGTIKQWLLNLPI